MGLYKKIKTSADEGDAESKRLVERIKTTLYQETSVLAEEDVPGLAEIIEKEFFAREPSIFDRIKMRFQKPKGEEEK